MKHFTVDQSELGFFLRHKGVSIAEGLTCEEANDAADHLERLFYNTPLETFSDLTAFQTAVYTDSSRVRQSL